MNYTKQRLIAIQADPLESLKPKSDSSLFIAAELCSRGYAVFFYTPNSISLHNDKLVANGEIAKVSFENDISSFSVIAQKEIILNHVDAILIRQDPPFNMEYVVNTYLLELLSNKVLILNNPQGIRDNNEKLSIFNFTKFIPDSMITHAAGINELSFIRKHTKVIAKPLFWFGGQNIELITYESNQQIQKQLNALLKKHQHILLQRFIDTVYHGDKRVFIIDGKAVGAIRRIPQEGQYITNLAFGGTADKTEITKKEMEIANSVGKYLKKQGIIFAGLDLIDEQLIEINLTSPTGLVAFYKLYGINLATNIVDYIERNIENLMLNKNDGY
jgi:glutathione synthase